jgi:carbonic anhydrase
VAGLTRRELLKAGGATAAVIGTAPFLGAIPAGPPPGAWNHDPASPIGPFHWGQNGFPVCGMGASQSPVNIATGRLVSLHGPPLILRYQSSQLGVENTGHVVEVPVPAGVTGTALIGGERYELVQYHFHAPAEHSVDGRLAEVEAHLVHMSARGVTAVVGVFFWLSNEPNPVLDKILLAAPWAAGDTAQAGEASPAELFHRVPGAHPIDGGHVMVNSFYAYSGSLTTPGCTEDVGWAVLAGGGGVSEAAVSRFHQVIAHFPFYDGYPDNNRPVQPLNGRAVKFRRHGKAP